MGVTKLIASRMVWESQPKRVTVPYAKADLSPVGYLSTAGHANPVGSWGVHSPRLNTLGDR